MRSPTCFCVWNILGLNAVGWFLWRCSSLVQRLLLTICQFWNPSQSLTKVCLGIHHFSRIHSSNLVKFCFKTLFSARLGCRGSQIVRPEQFCIPALFGRLSHSHEQITFSFLCWSPAEGILTDGVERSLAGETVQVPLVLQHHLARVVLIEAHQRLACLPTPLLPEMFKLTLQKQHVEKPVEGQGHVFQLLPCSPGASLLPQLLLRFIRNHLFSDDQGITCNGLTYREVKIAQRVKCLSLNYLSPVCLASGGHYCCWPVATTGPSHTISQWFFLKNHIWLLTPNIGMRSSAKTQNEKHPESSRWRAGDACRPVTDNFSPT